MTMGPLRKGQDPDNPFSGEFKIKDRPPPPTGNVKKDSPSQDKISLGESHILPEMQELHTVNYKYTVIVHTDLDILVDMVNVIVDNGAYPVGGIAIKQETKGLLTKYLQALMVPVEIETEKN